jgi:hypothetical protein
MNLICICYPRLTENNLLPASMGGILNFTGRNNTGASVPKIDL